jgi:hypothetical protein
MTGPLTFPPLPAGDLEVLEFEREVWKYQGAKDATIRERFACPPTHYYRRLHRILLDPAAVAYDPQLVRRLRDLAAQRARSRGAAL